ncbi:MAG: ATP-binding protein [Chromatiales bacterium]|jgi:signal transduction histidine kinase
MSSKPVDTENNDDSLLYSEQVRLLSHSIPTGASGNLFGVLIVTWVMWESLPVSDLLVWAFLLVASQLVRISIFVAVLRTPGRFSQRHWRSLLRAGILLGGVAWGLLPLFLFPADLPHQIFLAFVSAGFTGIVLVGLASDRVSVLLFGMPFIVPLLVRFLLEGGEIPTAIGLLMIPYLVYLTAAAYRGEAVFRENLMLREQADRHSAELTVARDEADRANQAKSEFLSSMSHELRTPLNAILGFSQLMERDGKLHAEHQEYVHEILKAGRHLLDLINEVLDLARIESGHLDLSIEPVAADQVVAECIGLVAPMADSYGITLGSGEPAGAIVRADRVRLKQVLLNLLSNAIKYNREAGEVHIATQVIDAEYLRIRVSDTGPGISATQQADLFQPFNRLDAGNSTIEGTGIGLTISRHLVEIMHGRLEFESSPGVGSSFWIELPIESVAQPDEHQAPLDTVVINEPVAPVSHTEGGHRTVLYIEDNPANLRLVEQIVARLEHIHLLTADNPALGIELVRAHRPELILLDINMPGMDGYKVLEILKADADLKHIPVVAVTAKAMQEDIEHGKAAGFIEYLTKPLDVPRFHTLLEQLLPS